MPLNTLSLVEARLGVTHSTRRFCATSNSCCMCELSATHLCCDRAVLIPWHNRGAGRQLQLSRVLQLAFLVRMLDRLQGVAVFRGALLAHRANTGVLRHSACGGASGQAALGAASRKPWFQCDRPKCVVSAAVREEGTRIRMRRGFAFKPGCAENYCANQDCSRIPANVNSLDAAVLQRQNCPRLDHLADE